MEVFVAGVPSSLAPRTLFFSCVLAPLPSPSPFTPATQATWEAKSEPEPRPPKAIQVPLKGFQKAPFYTNILSLQLSALTLFRMVLVNPWNVWQ